MASSASIQRGWRFCFKCMTLFFLGDNASGVTAGRCTFNDVHSAFKSGDYGLVVSNNGDFEKFVHAGQPNWRFCRKCHSLWFNGQADNGICAAGGAHSSTGSGDYAVMCQSPDFDASVAGQRNWRFCHKCLQLWFNGQGKKDICPGGGDHSSEGSGDYLLLSDDRAPFN